MMVDECHIFSLRGGRGRVFAESSLSGPWRPRLAEAQSKGSVQHVAVVALGSFLIFVRLSVVLSPVITDQHQAGDRTVRLFGSTFFGCFGRRAGNETLNRIQITESFPVSKEPKKVLPNCRSTLSTACL